MKKVAIVTGSSRGIGLAILKQLGKEGYEVVMVATGEKEKNETTLFQLQDENIQPLYIQGDIGKTSDREKILEETVKTFGRIDVLVNNAGVAPLERSDLLDMTEESFDRVVGINTKGNLFLTQLVAKQMLTQDLVDGKRGAIINVSSCSATVSSTNRGEYCVSKAGIAMLTTLFADRLAEEGIFVNEIRPGIIETDMTSGGKEKYDKLIAEGIFPSNVGENLKTWQKLFLFLQMIHFCTPQGISLTWMVVFILKNYKKGEYYECSCDFGRNRLRY